MRRISTLYLLPALCVLSISGVKTWANTPCTQKTPQITNISPSPAWLQPTDNISISGRFGQSQGKVQFTGTSGGAPVVFSQNILWSSNRIQFELPSALAPGTYQVSVRTAPCGDVSYVSNPMPLIVVQKQLLVKTSVLTQRYDNQRTGANVYETALNAQDVGSSAFQKLYEIDVDGQVYAQPLVVSNVVFSDGTVGDILLIATMNNSLFAFLVDNGLSASGSFAPVQLWKANFGQPVPANFMPMAGTADTCLFFGNLCLPNGNHDTPDAPVALPPVGNCCPPNFNINPSIGILSTPAVLVSQSGASFSLSSSLAATAGAVYGVAAVFEAGSNVAHHLFSVDLLTGRPINNIIISGSVPAHSPDSIAGLLAFNARQQMQRPALLADPFKKELFIAFGSHQDTRPWHGWIFKFQADAEGSLAAAQSRSIWTSTPGALGGAIWQAGSGLAQDDSNGIIYAMTGNGEDNVEGVQDTDQAFNTAHNNFANMFVALDPSLQQLGVSAFFAPGDEKARDKDDVDLGSAGPIKIPTRNILLGGDKEGLIFVLDTSKNLAMRQIFQASKPRDDFSVEGSGFHHIHGTPVIWRNSQGVLTLYVWPERDYLRSFSWDDKNSVFDCPDGSGQLAQCPGQPANPNPVLKSSIESPDCSFGTAGCSKMPGGIISISSNGTAVGSGIVWASMPTDTDSLYRVVPGVLRAFNAENLTTELWDSNMNSGRDGSFNFAKFVPPVVANGRVYMATFGNSAHTPGTVNIYGLLQNPPMHVSTAPDALILYPADQSAGKFFMGTKNGHLFENFWDETNKVWGWTDHGAPPGTTVSTAPGALIIYPGDQSAGKFFMGTANGHLFENFWDETNKVWGWTDHGAPPGTSVSTAPGALIIYPGDQSAGKFFMGTANGHLFENFWDETNKVWGWTDHGAPPGTSVSTAPGALIIYPGDQSAGKFFMGTANGHLFENFWDETNKVWGWTDHGAPPGTSVSTAPGALIIYPGDQSAGKFFMGTANGHLFENFWDETNKVWGWTDHGAPPGTSVSTAPGALIIYPGDQSAGKFFMGTANGHLFENFWDETNKVWGWTDHGAPPGTSVSTAPGALIIYPGDQSAGKFFMGTANGHLFENFWDETNKVWGWTDHGLATQ